jgi:hypothetical protein
MRRIDLIETNPTAELSAIAINARAKANFP